MIRFLSFSILVIIANASRYRLSIKIKPELRRVHIKCFHIVILNLIQNRAPESVQGQRGGSPLQADALRPVTERNCVTARWGGKQREVKSQSVG
jgi:hypothetical protein